MSVTSANAEYLSEVRRDYGFARDVVRSWRLCGLEIAGLVDLDARFKLVFTIAVACGPFESSAFVKVVYRKSLVLWHT